MEYKIGENGYLGTIEITEREHIIAEIAVCADSITSDKLNIIFYKNPELVVCAEHRIKRYEKAIQNLIVRLNDL